MDIEINPSHYLEGTISAPPSKSYAQRALALAFLVDKIRIKGMGKSDDEKAAIAILASCGFEIKEQEGVLEITNNFDFNKDVEINCAESGLSARMFSSILALNVGKTIIRGEGTLLKREMKMLGDFYTQIGAEYGLTEGKLPITLKGIRSHQNISIDGAISSQYVTGILYYMVGLRSAENLYLTIQNPVSMPYIHMTMEMLERIGAKLKWEDHNRILIEPSVLKSEVDIAIEGDWSSASFWMVAAAINGKISMTNLSNASLQADKEILTVLSAVGAKIESFENQIIVQKSELKAFEFDANHCPDLIPILSVLALFCDGISSIAGVDRLIHKESDRLNSILCELSRISDGITYSGNSLVINSKKNNFIKRAIAFETHRDHRIAMAAIILALNLQQASCVNDVDCIDKSYRDFLKIYKSLI